MSLTKHLMKDSSPDIESVDISWKIWLQLSWGFPGGKGVKNSLASAGDAGDSGLIPGPRRSGGGNGYPLQHSCLENPMNRGAWWAAVHGVTELDVTKHTHTHCDQGLCENLTVTQCNYLAQNSEVGIGISTLEIREWVPERLNRLPGVTQLCSKPIKRACANRRQIKEFWSRNSKL